MWDLGSDWAISHRVKRGCLLFDELPARQDETKAKRVIPVHTTSFEFFLAPHRKNSADTNNAKGTTNKAEVKCS